MATAIQFDRTFAASLEQRMEALGVPQTFLSAYCDFSQGELSKILSGLRTPDVVRVNKIQAALNELELLAQILSPIKLVWDEESVRSLVNGLVRKPEAGKEFQ